MDQPADIPEGFVRCCACSEQRVQTHPRIVTCWAGWPQFSQTVAVSSSASRMMSENLAAAGWSASSGRVVAEGAELRRALLDDVAGRDLGELSIQQGEKVERSCADVDGVRPAVRDAAADRLD